MLNLLIYLPLGVLGWAAMARQPATRRVLSPILLGFLLSGSMEFIQVYIPGRTPSLLDLLMNTIGTAIGVVFAWLFTDWLSARWPALTIYLYRDPGSGLLFALWLAAQWSPLMPGISLYTLRHKLGEAITINWDRLPSDLLSAASAWMAALLILETIAPWARRWVSLVPLFVVSARFLVARQQPTAADLAGMMVAALVYQTVLRATPFRMAIAAGFHLFALVVSGLAPFHFHSFAGPFQWVPFGATLEMGDWERAGVVVLAKAFRYGAAIWLLKRCHIGLLPGAVFVATLLGIIEWIQTYLPGRSAELTDPVMCLMLALTLWMLEHTPESSVSEVVPYGQPTAKSSAAPCAKIERL